MERDPKTEKFYEQIKNATNAIGKPHFSPLPTEEIKVSIRPDNSVSPAKFIPDPLVLGGYKAHPDTIRAMRKDIFAAGDNLFEELECLQKCKVCSEKLDIQFWIHCPYCGGIFD